MSLSCRSMCGCAGKPSLAAAPARSTRRAKPAVVKGEPRSDTKVKGDLASRFNTRSARNSSPRIGCVLGVPFLLAWDTRNSQLD